MRHIRSYLTSRAVATGAAVALLGGGAAIAVEGTTTHDADTTSEDEAEADSDEDGEEDGEETRTDSENEAEEGSDDDTQEAEADSEDNSHETGDEAQTEEDPEQPNTDPASDADPLDDSDASETAGDERSKTATRVHGELSGDPGIGPGHEEFGARVSKNAREGGLGQAVSRAARGIDTDEPKQHEAAEETVEPEGAGAATTRKPGPPAHARGRG